MSCVGARIHQEVKEGGVSDWNLLEGLGGVGGGRKYRCLFVAWRERDEGVREGKCRVFACLSELEVCRVVVSFLPGPEVV